MKVAARAIDGFVRRPDPGVRVVLVFGPDDGLIRERAAALIDHAVPDSADPFAVSEVMADVLRSDVRQLIDAAHTVPLGGGRRLVVVRHANDTTAPAVRALLDATTATADRDFLVVILAGDLNARSGLRRLCEKNDNAAAMACYGDDPATLTDIIVETARELDVTVSRDALAYLSDQLGSDRQVTRREIEKLALYIGPGGRADIDDARAIVGDSVAQTVDDAILAAMDGDQGALSAALGRMWADGASAVMVLRATQRHVVRLIRVVQFVAGGMRPVDAVGRLRPPVFWKLRDRIGRQAGRWRNEPLAAVLQRLTQAEIEAKGGRIDERLACERALIAIAQRAQRLT